MEDQKEKINKQKKNFEKLIKDLNDAVITYNKASGQFGACLISDSDLKPWEELNPHLRKEDFFIKMNRFWGMNIALTYALTFIPLEELA